MFRILCIATLLAATAQSLHALTALTRPARAAWLSEATGYKPGEPVVTALRMTLGRGWHTYWINPGEAGMPMNAKFELPEGWLASPVQYPFPERFRTGELHDFGYSGTVWFPIILYPPADASGDVEITGEFSWLTCDDSACVPGDATLKLRLISGESEPTAAAENITEAMRRVPTLAPMGWQLDVKTTEDSLELHLALPESIAAKELDVFPLTVNVIHPASAFEWKADDGAYKAIVTKSPYAPDSIESLELVINHSSLDQPVTVGWTKE